MASHALVETGLLLLMILPPHRWSGEIAGRGRRELVGHVLDDAAVDADKFDDYLARCPVDPVVPHGVVAAAVLTVGPVEGTQLHRPIVDRERLLVSFEELPGVLIGGE